MKTIASRSRIPTQTHKLSRAVSGNGHVPGTAQARISAKVAAWLKKPKRNLIGGKWSSAASGKLFDVFNPADASVITRVPDSAKEDINRAVGAARRGRPGRTRSAGAERGRARGREGQSRRGAVRAGDR